MFFNGFAKIFTGCFYLFFKFNLYSFIFTKFNKLLTPFTLICFYKYIGRSTVFFPVYFWCFSNCFQSLTAAFASSASCCCCTFAMLFGPAATSTSATKNCKVHKMLLPQHKGIYICAALPGYLCVLNILRF